MDYTKIEEPYQYEYINTTPHKIRIMNLDGQIVEIEPGPQIRCTHEVKEILLKFHNMRMVLNGKYSLDEDSIKPIHKNAKALIVSTIVAQHADELRKICGKYVQIIVPDSGPTAVRDIHGKINYITQLISY